MTTTADLQARAEAVADDLVGTCQSLHDKATDHEQNSSVFCARLDELVFCCEQCGWWSLIEEMGAVEQVCDECIGTYDGD